MFAWILAGNVLAPVGAVTALARRLSERHLSERIPVEGDDEVAELARTFNTMLDRVEDAFRTKRDFLNDVSHEMRTPITIVRGHLELMGDDPDERREVVALVTEELDRMARLVDDLLVLARAEQPGFLRLATVDVADLTSSVAAKLRGLAPREWVVGATATDTVMTGDPDRLTQAMLNLASNAVSQTDAGSSIRIGSRQEGDKVALWVSDDGPGMSPEVQGRIFERFASGGSKGAGNGTGLGLAIVRAIAEAHRGQVTVTSAPGEGATFTLLLPLHAPSR
ncbi:MAG TPA: HAMP domain-containing sensor histidine kinase [Acidimicrobiales bacterium]|nr:HAMP domain-containing sensor histidine kinase [Acidimicrobiales bacterium]